jgi:hypothetical protein
MFHPAADFHKVKPNSLFKANHFTGLYYTYDIWLFPSLKPQVKQQLLSASANVL